MVWVEGRGGEPCRDELAVEYAVFTEAKRRARPRSPRRLGFVRATCVHGRCAVTSGTPDDLVKRGLDVESLLDRFPHLVVCGITGFGQSGRDRVCARI